MKINLKHVTIPTEGVILSDKHADNGLFFVFKKNGEFIGVLRYNSDNDSYYIESATNGIRVLDYGEPGESLLDFYKRLLEGYKDSYLMFVETSI